MRKVVYFKQTESGPSVEKAKDSKNFKNFYRHFWISSQKHKGEKIYKWDYIKLRNFFTAKEIITGKGDNPQRKEKIFKLYDKN